MGLLGAEQVGLYINPDYIEVVIVEKQFKNIKVKNVYRKNISIQDMDLPDQNEIIKNSINELFNVNKISRTNVFLNLPTQEVVLRTFSMSRIDKEDWANAIRFEGQKHVPFKINEMVADYHVLDPDAETSEMTVLFVCAKMSSVSRYISILNSISIRCKFLNSVYLSMVRYINFINITEPERPYLIVSIKKKIFGRDRINYSADLVVYHKNIPYISRDISIVASQNEIDERFLNELYLSVKLFNSSFEGDLQIQDVLFLEGGDLHKWDEFFSENFNATVKFLDVPKTVGVEDVSAVAVGTALSSLALPEIKINLMLSASSEIAVTIPFDFKKICIGESVVAAIVLLMVFFMYAPKMMKINKDLRRELTEIGQYEALSLEDIKKMKSDVSSKVTFINRLVADNPKLTPKLKEVSSIIEQDSWLEIITYENKMETRRSKKAGIMHVIGRVYKNDKIQDMLLVNKIKTAVNKNKTMMDKFKYCLIEEMSAVKFDKYTATNFDISLRQQPKD